MPSFHVKKATNGQFFFRLKSDNGETILASETYKSHASALNGIESVRKNALIPERFEKKVSVRKEPFFVLRAGNYEVIGTGELYKTEAARDGGIAAVCRDAPTATIVDDSVPEKGAAKACGGVC